MTFLFRLLLLCLLLGTGCLPATKPPASPDDPLRLAISLSGVALNSASDGSDDAVEVDYRQRVDVCLSKPVTERAGCIATAKEESAARAKGRNDKLREAVRWQNEARELANAARTCRQTQSSCEAAKLREAQKLLSDVAEILSNLKAK